MESAREVRVYVDPQCPYAWITVNWLWECEKQGAVTAHLDLMSLAAHNEHRDLDEEYRAFNDEAWGTARVAAALLAQDPQRWPTFYLDYGTRRHVRREREGGMRATTEAVLDDLGLSELAVDYDNPAWDDQLRQRTTHAMAGVEGGAPMLHLESRAFFGPVLTQIPRGEAAVKLLDAVFVLATTPGFGDICGVRDSELATS